MGTSYFCGGKGRGAVGIGFCKGFCHHYHCFSQWIMSIGFAASGLCNRELLEGLDGQGNERAT